MHTDIVILAGGASSRMKASNSAGLTEAEVHEANTTSKSLIRLENGKPLLHFLLLNIKKAGYQRVTLIVSSANGSAFKDFFGTKYMGLTMEYATQEIPTNRTKPLGTADALAQAIEQQFYLKATQFTVCNSDNLYSVWALRALRETKEPNAFIAYDRDGLQFSEERIARFALVQLDALYYLKNIVEKPNPRTLDDYRDADGRLRVSMNIFKMTGRVILPFLEQCPIHPARLEKELPTAILSMIKKGGNRMRAIPKKEHVPDLTSKEDIQSLRKHLKDSMD